jgi:hypothetical protein
VQGDVLLAINQQQINAANAADTIASQLCKGPAGSLVEVQFSRGILGQVSGQNCSNFLSGRALCCTTTRCFDAHIQSYCSFDTQDHHDLVPFSFDKI